MARLLRALAIFGTAASLYAEAPPPPAAPRASAAPPAPAAPAGASPTSAPPAEAAPLPAASPVLAYVPDDADLAVFVRADQLTRTNLWKKLAAPEVGFHQWLFRNFPSGIDFQNDVAAAAQVVQIAYSDGRPDGANVAFILEMNRDIRAADLVKVPDEAVAIQDLSFPAYHVVPLGLDLAAPSPRIVVLASPDYLARIVRYPERAKTPPQAPLAVDALSAPGEITFAGRVSPNLKDAIRAEYEKMQRDCLRPDMGGERLMQFGLYYNLVRIGLETESVTGALDLARQADALRADVRLASNAMAPFLTAIAQAMADPLQMGLPALVGGEPLPEPPPEPFYRAAADGQTVHLAMPRVGLERLLDRISEVKRHESARRASARNLMALGQAIRAYGASHGETSPQTWSDLVKADLLRDPAVFENPSVKAHRPGGDYELVPLPKAIPNSKRLRTVNAYEVHPKEAPPRRLNVLFADGHVEYMEYSIFQQHYKETLEGLGP